jgi:glycosyltransferase involved in cell wall biosynthesis
MELLSRALCFCLPSKSEGFPLSLPEALGLGVPLVISKECNFPEAARRGAALELDNYDPGQWAQALDSLLLDPQRLSQMSEKALELGREMAWPSLVYKWLSVYEGLWKSLPDAQRSVS